METVTVEPDMAGENRTELTPGQDGETLSVTTSEPDNDQADVSEGVPEEDNNADRDSDVNANKTPKKRRKWRKWMVGGILSLLAVAAAVGTGAYCLNQRGDGDEVPVIATPTVSAAAGSPTPEPTAPPIPEGEVVASAIRVPSNLSDIKPFPLNNSFPERQWVHPIYDPVTADSTHDWRGIGPHYPIAFENIDPNAAVVTSHGNVGEVIVKSDKGGEIMIAFMQINGHQKDGAWGKDQNGNSIKGDWTMQYNMHGLAPHQEIRVVDPDTGKQMFWPDGSSVIYEANDQGIAAFELPETISNDVRVGFQFSVPENAGHEFIIHRGPHDRSEVKVNPLPKGVVKPLVPGDGNQ